METAVKIAQIELEKTREIETYSLIREMIRNPVLELLAGAALINVMSRYPADKPFLSGFEEKVGSAALISIISAQQVSSLLPELTKSGGIMDLIRMLIAGFKK